jgi:hypothetical protein
MKPDLILPPGLSHEAYGPPAGQPHDLPREQHETYPSLGLNPVHFDIDGTPLQRRRHRRLRPDPGNEPTVTTPEDRA